MREYMNIRFRDVTTGIVDARAVLEILPGIMINEITILKKNNNVIVELPQKSFKGKDEKIHFLNIITFENENQETIWKMEVKEEYLKWRKKNKKVLVYDSE